MNIGDHNERARYRLQLSGSLRAATPRRLMQIARRITWLQPVILGMFKNVVGYIRSCPLRIRRLRHQFKMRKIERIRNVTATIVIVIAVLLLLRVIVPSGKCCATALLIAYAQSRSARLWPVLCTGINPYGTAQGDTSLPIFGPGDTITTVLQYFT